MCLFDNLEYAEVNGLDVYMPDNFLEALDEKEEGEKRYHKSKFEYDEGSQVYQKIELSRSEVLSFSIGIGIV